MSNLTTFSQANLPALNTLSTALRRLEAEVGPAGVAILKMDKTGHWVFGADQTEIEDGATWAINPYSFTHGFIAWGDGEVLAEKMASVSEPLPEVDAAPPGAKNGWQKQVGMSLKCLDGEDKGLECRYAVTSVGGVRAVQQLAVAIATQVDRDASKPVPVVVLKKDHYQHKSYGRIYTPVFDIVDWMGMDGSAATEEAEAAEEVAEAPASGRRRRAA
ncbi:MAG: hypothetical protein ACO23G_14200, partial [Limnohabitans sp.]